MFTACPLMRTSSAFRYFRPTLHSASQARQMTLGEAPPGGDQPVHALVLPDATTALCGRTAPAGLGWTIPYDQP